MSLISHSELFQQQCNDLASRMNAAAGTAIGIGPELAAEIWMAKSVVWIAVMDGEASRVLYQLAHKSRWHRLYRRLKHDMIPHLDPKRIIHLI